MIPTIPPPPGPSRESLWIAAGLCFVGAIAMAALLIGEMMR